MDDDDFFYPDSFEFKGISYKGQRSNNELLILIDTNDCPFDISEVVTQKIGSKERFFEVADWSVQSSEGMGGKPYLAVLNVRSLDALPKNNPISQTFNFNASVTASNLQAGNNNSIKQEITIQQLADEIRKSGDAEAKGLLDRLLNNQTVAGILSAVAGACIGS
ncbi:hypothetical protein [Buttiauxella sp. A111]|uniref:hypothetical protein n=1 Tax=Buttiauxella sp. A111 TaxID=2563088 RepID=UPI0010E6FDDB|nr:hypothetical protein [Buttiauxella sp. A111]GDX05718.1 hypothetical protein BSPA111_19190 [Buttiauxella sp. A111]